MLQKKKLFYTTFKMFIIIRKIFCTITFNKLTKKTDKPYSGVQKTIQLTTVSDKAILKFFEYKKAIK